jgi:hypothetical protein
VPANGVSVDVQQTTEQNVNRTNDPLLQMAAERLHNAWQPRHRDDLRPTTAAIISKRQHDWQHVADTLRSKYPNADNRHLVELLLDAAGDVRCADNWRRNLRDLAAGHSAAHNDGARPVGALVASLHNNLAPTNSENP